MRGQGQVLPDPSREEALPTPDIDRLDWLEIKAMGECPQDPLFHPEGDVLTHTKMVLAALEEDQAFKGLCKEDKEDLRWAALLHDIGKPKVTREEDGRITSPGHSMLGSKIARERLWRAGLKYSRRERIAALVRFHMIPFYILDKEPAEARRQTLHLSLLAAPRHLAILARADARGRGALDRETQAEKVGIFEMFAEDLDCLEKTFPFPSDHSRVIYFRKPSRNPYYEAYDDTRAEVRVMVGLPGAGKDEWVKRHSQDPVISLDEIRKAEGIDARKNQGPVVTQARNLAKDYLRSGQSFTWNATNVSYHQREQILKLFYDYKARINIVSVETTAQRLYTQNKARDEAVPEEVLEKLIRRWQAPDLSEAHQVTVAEID